jgi:phosphoribosylamine--glycine ligase
MKVLLIGGGGREHALAWKLAQSPRVTALYAMPGNPGIAEYADLVPGDPFNFPAVAKFVRQNNIGLVVVGPEDPLVAGFADALKDSGAKVFGPSKEAARIEGD